MKNFVYLFLCFASVVYAQNENEKMNPSPSPVCFDKGTLSSTEHIGQLSPATSPSELLQLLRKLHDHFFLLDPTFVKDVNLLRLFGLEKIDSSQSQILLPHIKKEIDIKTSGKLAIPIKFSYLEKSRSDRGLATGDITVFFQKPGSIYTVELIEKYLLPDVKGKDPIGPGFIPATNETLDAAVRRPHPTHPKGYFEYWLVNETKQCWSRLYVRLHQDGTAWDIDLEQKEKKQ